MKTREDSREVRKKGAIERALQFEFWAKNSYLPPSIFPSKASQATACLKHCSAFMWEIYKHKEHENGKVSLSTRKAKRERERENSLTSLHTPLPTKESSVYSSLVLLLYRGLQNSQNCFKNIPMIRHSVENKGVISFFQNIHLSFSYQKEVAIFAKT